MSKETILNDTKVRDISNKVIVFYERMRAIAQFLKKHKAPKYLQIASRMPLEFYIDKDSLAKLVKISQEKDCHALGVFFGIEKLKDQSTIDETNPAPAAMTGCFLGVKKNLEICNCHIDRDTIVTSGGLPGQDTWPPPPPGPTARTKGDNPVNYFTLSSKEKDLKKYFHVDDFPFPVEKEKKLAVPAKKAARPGKKTPGRTRRGTGSKSR